MWRRIGEALAEREGMRAELSLAIFAFALEELPRLVEPRVGQKFISTRQLRYHRHTPARPSWRIELLRRPLGVQTFRAIIKRSSRFKDTMKDVALVPPKEIESVGELP